MAQIIKNGGVAEEAHIGEMVQRTDAIIAEIESLITDSAKLLAMFGGSRGAELLVKSSDLVEIQTALGESYTAADKARRRLKDIGERR